MMDSVWWLWSPHSFIPTTPADPIRKMPVSFASRDRPDTAMIDSQVAVLFDRSMSGVPAGSAWRSAWDGFAVWWMPTTRPSVASPARTDASGLRATTAPLLLGLGGERDGLRGRARLLVGGVRLHR